MPFYYFFQSEEAFQQRSLGCCSIIHYSTRDTGVKCACIHHGFILFYFKVDNEHPIYSRHFC